MRVLTYIAEDPKLVTGWYILDASGGAEAGPFASEGNGSAYMRACRAAFERRQFSEMMEPCFNAAFAVGYRFARERDPGDHW